MGMQLKRLARKSLSTENHQLFFDTIIDLVIFLAKMPNIHLVLHVKREV